MPLLATPAKPATSITDGEDEYGLWIPHGTIRWRVAAMAAYIAKVYRGKRIRLIAVLQGAKPFHDLLLEELQTIPNGPLVIETDSLRAKSYSGTKSGQLKWLKHPDLPARADTHEIIVEDIVDSGRTIAAVTDYLADRGAASVVAAVLLDRPEARAADINFTPQLAAFEITDPHVWAIGFGMDLDEEYRDLPDIYGKLPPSGHLPGYRLPNLDLS